MSLLLERNVDHLRQATLDGTPFTTAPLKELFGLYGTSKAAYQILAGTFDIKSLGLSEEVMLWLEELAYDDDGLFEHRKGAFYSHSREESIDGEASIFRIQTTRKPIPMNNMYPYYGDAKIGRASP